MPTPCTRARPPTWSSTSLEAWEWTIRTCLTSQFLCCRAVIPHMLEIGGGSIINVSSGNGLAGSTTAAAYGAAKAGVVVLTKYIATQYGKRGIRCNTIVPGWTVGGTAWMRPEAEMTDADRGLLDAALEDVCMDRLAVADDIAPVVAFLASDDAAYVQGGDDRGERRPARSHARRGGVARTDGEEPPLMTAGSRRPEPP